MVGFGFLALFLAFGALAFVDAGSDATPEDDDTTEDPSSDPGPETPTGPGTGPDTAGQGGPGNDLITPLDGVSLYNGFGGDDTLITYGDSTLLGGDGDDSLVSYGGAAVLNGGEGEDTFVINLLGVTDDGGLLDVFGQPVAPAVINDFNPDDDQLVLDLSASGFAPMVDAPVLLTGVLAPDGEGLMVQVNGVNVVQLSTYGGGDMQAALEQLNIGVIGAAFEFPADTSVPPSPFPTGLSVTEDEDGDVVLALTDAFEGGGNYGGGDEFSILDLSALTADMRVTVLDGDIIVIEPMDGSLPATTFEEIDRVILGNGDDVFDGSDGSGFVEAVAGNGNDTLSASTNGTQNELHGEGFMRLEGGAEVIDGTGPTTILGGVGNHVLSAGLGDTLSGGAGSDTFVIYGVGDDGAGPARITDFNPLTNDGLVYIPVNTDGSDAPHDVVIQVEDFSTSIIDNGEVVVVIQDIGRFYDPTITVLDPVNRLRV